MDPFTNGYSCGTGHFSVQNVCHLYWHGGCQGIADDMIIAGKDEMEHDGNFLAFMEKCMENNLTLNSEKIQFKQSQVSFYGHIWSEHRISPDTKKIQALKHMEFPPDKETMRSFLGIVHLTKSDTASASLISESEEREEIAETADVPAPTPTPVPALERVKEQSHTPGSRKSTRKNLGRPASSYSDFYM